MFSTVAHSPKGLMGARTKKKLVVAFALKDASANMQGMDIIKGKKN